MVCCDVCPVRGRGRCEWFTAPVWRPRGKTQRYVVSPVCDATRVVVSPGGGRHKA